MSNELAKPSQRAQGMGAKDVLPNLGEWYWVMCSDSQGKNTCERLLCVTHIASNYVAFSRCDERGYRTTWKIRHRDLAGCTRIELKWQDFLNKWIEEKKVELNLKVREICDAVQGAGLIKSPEAAPTLLPSLARQSPEEHKQALIKLKTKDIPALQKDVERITQEITALHRDLILPQDAQMHQMRDAMKSVDQRLFALELYAGLFQQCKQIRKGVPAPKETPITVRQMLRFMDEECLIEYDGGGMDYHNLEDFDEWVAKDENLNRLAPEPRCIVALQVRRHLKDYGPIRSMFDALAQSAQHEENQKTYLLLRNGTHVHRLWADISFRPRLLPYREEFVKPFTKTGYKWNSKEKAHTQVEEKITPDDLEYDEHVEKRLGEIYKYNRVMFLVQGLLDRSEVFHPHPPINLADQDHVEQWFKAVFDEELGLPSANPPKWEDYRDLKNAQLSVGDFIWSNWYDEDNDYERSRYDRFRETLKESRARPDEIMQVDRISRDRSKVRVSWEWGERRSYWRLSRWDRHGVSETCERMRHAWLPMKEVFNVSAYKCGEFKQFLCDAYLKGAYLKWAPPLLDAEKWHAQRKKTAETKGQKQ